MIALNQPNISFVIFCSQKLNDIISILYAKDYVVMPLQSFYHGDYEDSVMAFSKVDNDILRQDVLQLLNIFHEDFAIIKYNGEGEAKKIFRDGQEKPLKIIEFNTDSDNRSFLYNGISFSFLESVRYWKPTKKEDFTVGMLVEYFNGNKWSQKEVKNPNEDYEKFFKLLIKYDKLRVASTK